MESALAAELKHSESRLPLLYALLTVPLLPSLNSPLPLDKIPSPSALLLRFLSPTFSLQHLWRPDKAAMLRDQLLACNANSLAKRVWKEGEVTPRTRTEARAERDQGTLFSLSLRAVCVVLSASLGRGLGRVHSCSRKASAARIGAADHLRLSPPPPPLLFRVQFTSRVAPHIASAARIGRHCTGLGVRALARGG